MTSPLEIAIVNLGGLDWERRRPNRRARANAPMAASAFAFLPYAAGLLQAYVARHAAAPERYTFRPPLFQRDAVERLCARLDGVDVAGFSLYCWNNELSLAVARALKARQPATRIVVGGPHVPDDAAAFMTAYPFVDAAVHGEGEATFLAWLESEDDETRASVAGVTARRPDGSVVTNAKPPRLRDLDAIPSPYLAGMFDQLIASHPELGWHALWETNRGCPFACTFCDWGSATAAKVYQFSIERVRAEIDWMAAQRVELVFGCDANFGLLPRDVDIAEYLAEVRARTGHPALIGVQNTKNATERAYKIQRLLGGASPSGVTISLQSVDQATLKAIKRDNISLGSFQELQRRYTRDGIDTYTDIILGLAGETYESFARGVATVIDNGQHNRIQFYNCYLLPNAEMAQPAYRQQYGLQTVIQRIVDTHQPTARAEGHVDEHLELVAATAAMPAGDWVRAKTFWWMTDLLHCNRVLQVAFSSLNTAHHLAYNVLIEAFTTADRQRFPVTGRLLEFFEAKARAIQQGDCEYVPSEEWLGVHWPADEYALVDLVTSFRIELFYDEARTILRELVAAASPEADLQLVDDAVRLNAALLKVPFEVDDLELTLSHDVWECHQDLIAGRRRAPARAATKYRITRTRPLWLSAESWCEDVLGRSNRKQAFLYPIDAIPSLVPNAHTTAIQAGVHGAPPPAAPGSAH